MSEQTIVKLTASARATDKNPRQLRSEGFLPATVYGKGLENSVSIQMNAHEFNMAYKNAPEAVYEITVDKQKYTAKVQEAQIHYADNTILNVEFKTV